MRKLSLSNSLAKASAYGLLIGGISLIMSASALAADGNIAYTSCTSCNSGTDTNCNECDGIFTEAAKKLNVQYEQVLANCCAPENCTTGCSSTSCGTCGTGTCGSGCDWCNLGEAWSLNDQIFGEESSIKIGGWAQLGYHSNGNTLFNNQPNKVNLQQTWLYIEKIADGSNGWDWGFRADIMYGIDGTDTQAFGNNPGEWDFQNGFDNGIYSWALPQAYVEVANGNLSVKVGHFFTLAGYEVVGAPGNFFYSHAYTMYNSEPFTHTGAIATYTVNDDVELYGGWTAGWDTGFDQNNGGSNFLGGASVSVTDNSRLTYITTFGDLGARGDGYSHSLVWDINVTEKLNYVIQTDLVETNAGSDHQGGLNQYLLYAYNDCLGFGTRMEWWSNAGNSQYASTWGVNYKPLANLTLRPEWRYDWNPGTGTEFGTWAMDAILTF